MHTWCICATHFHKARVMENYLNLRGGEADTHTHPAHVPRTHEDGQRPAAGAFQRMEAEPDR